MKPQETLKKILGGSRNIRFADDVALVEAYGFRLARTRGSHHIFTHPRVKELLNLQNVKGEAKPYRIRQFLRLIERYNLEIAAREPED